MRDRNENRKPLPEEKRSDEEMLKRLMDELFPPPSQKVHEGPKRKRKSAARLKVKR